MNIKLFTILDNLITFTLILKKIIIISWFVLLGLVSASFIFIQKSSDAKIQETEKIKWYTFQQAVEMNKKEKKKIFIDVYTDWCGWCKVMDKNTFTHPIIVRYINEKYYAVKLNAEMKDTIIFNNTTFVNPNPKVARSTHQLAASLLNNRLSYPTTVYLDENFNMLTQVPGYLKPVDIEPILKYFGDNAYSKMKWEDYQKNFKGEIVVPSPALHPSQGQH